MSPKRLEFVWEAFSVVQGKASTLPLTVNSRQSVELLSHFFFAEPAFAVACIQDFNNVYLYLLKAKPSLLVCFLLVKWNKDGVVSLG